jgi:ABC-type transport system involved in multi-copper enzyme maturation permease subunit
MLERLERLLGPIFNKEAVEIARRPRFYFSRSLYGAALLIILLITWQETYWLRHPNAMARVARDLFEMATIVQYAAVYLFVPLFLCATIAGEREERTLELLFATPLRDREIILGKLVSRVAAMACLVLCGLPVLSFVMFFGGVQPESLWRVLAATLLAVFFVGSHAIYFSTVTGSTLGALVRTYWWLALWLVGVPLLTIAIFDTGPGTYVQQAIGVLAFVNPILGLLAVMTPQFHAFMTMFAGSWFLAATFVLPLAWSLFLIWRSVRRLRETPRPMLAWVRRLPKVKTVWQWWNNPQAVALRRARARSFAGCVVANPLWLRGRLAQIYDRTGHLKAIQYGGWVLAVMSVLLVAMVNPRDLDDEEMTMVFVGFAWGAVAALAALLAGSSVVGDRRRGFLELVLVTPLTGREIVGGVFLAVWEHLRPLFWLPWALGIFFCLTGASPVWGVAACCITATLFIIVVMWHGLACSLVARTWPAALVTTFLLPAVVLAVLPMFMIFEEHQGPVFWVVAAVMLVGVGVWSRRRRTLAAVTACSIAVHVAIAAAATFWTYDGRRDEYPVLAMHPAFLVNGLLDPRPERWFRIREWLMMAPAYWLALVLNIAWLRYWLVKHFDALAERTSAEMTTASPVTSTPVEAAPALTLSLPVR